MLGWPGATVVGTSSILSISPSSIAAMRTLRAKGEAAEYVSFMGNPLHKAQTNATVILRSAPLARVSKDGHSNVSFIILRGSPDGAPAPPGSHLRMTVESTPR